MVFLCHAWVWISLFYDNFEILENYHGKTISGPIPQS